MYQKRLVFIRGVSLSADSGKKKLANNISYSLFILGRSDEEMTGKYTGIR